MQTVKGTDTAHQGHDVGKDHAQGIDPTEGEVPVHELDNAEDPLFGHHKDVKKGQNRHQHHKSFLGRPLDQRQHEAANDQDQRGMQPEIIHRSSPRGS